MNRLKSETREQVISCLIEGCSIRAAVRMTGVAKKTVMRLFVEVGEVCAIYQDQVFLNHVHVGFKGICSDLRWNQLASHQAEAACSASFGEALHKVVERLFSQTGESRGCDCAKLLRVQLHQDSPHAADESSDGRWRRNTTVERRGFGCPLGSL
jgi:hypothetical protein